LELPCSCLPALAPLLLLLLFPEAEVPLRRLRLRGVPCSLVLALAVTRSAPLLNEGTSPVGGIPDGDTGMPATPRSLLGSENIRDTCNQSYDTAGDRRAGRRRDRVRQPSELDTEG
jgi:hypothetical protein